MLNTEIAFEIKTLMPSDVKFSNIMNNNKQYLSFIIYFFNQHNQEIALMQQEILNMYNNIVLLVDFALIKDSVGRQSILNVTVTF